MPAAVGYSSITIMPGKTNQVNGEVARRRNAPISLEHIDALPDEGVSSLYAGSLRERAKRLNQAAHGQEQPQTPEQALSRREEFVRRG